jgi:hypothetical protein
VGRIAGSGVTTFMSAWNLAAFGESFANPVRNLANVNRRPGGPFRRRASGIENDASVVRRPGAGDLAGAIGGLFDTIGGIFSEAADLTGSAVRDWRYHHRVRQLRGGALVGPDRPA